MKITEAALRRIVRKLINEQEAGLDLEDLRMQILDLNQIVQNSDSPFMPSDDKYTLYHLINKYESLGGDMEELRRAGVRGA